jgi:hypothetical protein
MASLRRDILALHQSTAEVDERNDHLEQTVIEMAKSIEQFIEQLKKQVNTPHQG